MTTSTKKIHIFPLQSEQKDAKETARCKWVLVVFNIAVNEFDTNKSGRYSRMLVVTELVENENRCSELALIQ